MKKQTLYEILGVEPTATDEELRRAYRMSAKRAHPDRGGDAARMAEINVAYETLSDPPRRLHYDKTGQKQILDEVKAAEAMLADRIISWLQAEGNESHDMVVELAWQLREERANALAHKAKGEGIYRKLTEKFARLKSKKLGIDRVRESIRFQIESINQQVQGVGKNIEHIELAIKLLEDGYEYEPDLTAPINLFHHFPHR